MMGRDSVINLSHSDSEIKRQPRTGGKYSLSNDHDVAAQLKPASHSQAIKQLKILVLINPGASSEWCNLGTLLLRVQQKEEKKIRQVSKPRSFSLHCFKAALAVESDSLRSRFKYAGALLRKKQEKKAVFHFKAVFTKDITYENVYLDEVQEKINKQCYEQALSDLKIMVQCKPDCALALKLTGQALLASNCVSLALQCFDQSKALAPHDWSCPASLKLEDIDKNSPNFDQQLILLGSLLIQDSNRSEQHLFKAIQAWVKVLRRNPSLLTQQLEEEELSRIRNNPKLLHNYSVVLGNLGYAFFRCRQKEKAELCYRRARQLQPKDKDVFRHWFEVMVELNAKAAERELLAGTVQDVTCFTVLANLHLQKGNLEMARKYLKSALALEPFSLIIAKQLLELQCNTNTQQYQLIQEQLAASLPPSSLKTFYQGCSYTHLGRWKEAERCFRNLLEAKPGLVKVCINLATVLLNQNRKDEGLRYLLLSMRLDPTFAPTFVRLGNLLCVFGEEYLKKEVFRGCMQVFQACKGEGKVVFNLGLFFSALFQFQLSLLFFFTAMQLFGKDKPALKECLWGLKESYSEVARVDTDQFLIYHFYKGVLEYDVGLKCSFFEACARSGHFSGEQSVLRHLVARVLTTNKCFYLQWQKYLFKFYLFNATQKLQQAEQHLNFESMLTLVQQLLPSARITPHNILGAIQKMSRKLKKEREKQSKKQRKKHQFASTNFFSDITPKLKHHKRLLFALLDSYFSNQDFETDSPYFLQFWHQCFQSTLELLSRKDEYLGLDFKKMVQVCLLQGLAETIFKAMFKTTLEESRGQITKEWFMELLELMRDKMKEAKSCNLRTSEIDPYIDFVYSSSNQADLSNNDPISVASELYQGTPYQSSSPNPRNRVKYLQSKCANTFQQILNSRRLHLFSVGSTADTEEEGEGEEDEWEGNSGTHLNHFHSELDVDSENNSYEQKSKLSDNEAAVSQQKLSSDWSSTNEDSLTMKKRRESFGEDQQLARLLFLNYLLLVKHLSSLRHKLKYIARHEILNIRYNPLDHSYQSCEVRVERGLQPFQAENSSFAGQSWSQGKQEMNLFLKCLMRGILELQKHNIFHCDLSLRSMMRINSDGRPVYKIIDFDYAFRVSSETSPVRKLFQTWLERDQDEEKPNIIDLIFRGILQSQSKWLVLRSLMEIKRDRLLEEEDKIDLLMSTLRRYSFQYHKIQFIILLKNLLGRKMTHQEQDLLELANNIPIQSEEANQHGYLQLLKSTEETNNN